MFVGRRDSQARPTVILIPTVMGVSDLEIGFGRQLVELGYNAFVADLFGKKFRGAPRDTMFGEMNRLQGRPRGAPAPAAVTCSIWRAASTRCTSARSSSPAIASAACARSISRAAARISPRRFASTACSTRPASAREDQGQGRRLPRLGRSDGAAGKGRRAGPGADRGRLRLADPRLRPRRPRLHQSEGDRPPDRRRRATMRSPPSGRGPASSTCSRNCSPRMAEPRADRCRSRGGQPPDAAGEGNRAARQALSRPGRAGDFRRRL